jgi:hypothetical protein
MLLENVLQMKLSGSTLGNVVFVILRINSMQSSVMNTCLWVILL